MTTTRVIRYENDTVAECIILAAYKYNNNTLFNGYVYNLTICIRLVFRAVVYYLFEDDILKNKKKRYE